MKTAPSPVSIPADVIHDYHINGLNGRYVHLPTHKKGQRTIIFIHGIHASQERLYSISQFLNEYGEVYVPDLPGFGGMDSFYSIGLKPSYDAYADYLYTFLKTHKLTSDLTFFGMSFGSQILTRMYQKYPESQAWTRQAIGFVGFAAADNFKIPLPAKSAIYALAYTARSRGGALLLNLLVFNRYSLKLLMAIFTRVKAKMQSEDSQFKSDMRQMETQLWTVNDRRTHGASTILMFRKDLRDFADTKINLEMINIMTKDDQYFDHAKVERSFKDLYKSYTEYDLTLHVHAPSMIADKAEVGIMIPEKIKRLLAKP